MQAMCHVRAWKTVFSICGQPGAFYRVCWPIFVGPRAYRRELGSADRVDRRGVQGAQQTPDDTSAGMRLGESGRDLAHF
jgi:hypothetical protein